MIAAMAFVPLDQVKSVFADLKENFAQHGDLTEVLSYFEINYVGVSSGRKAKFDAGIWNVTGQVCENTPKTNNYVEGFNNRMKHAIGCSHPSLGFLIDILKKEHKITDFFIIQSDMKVDNIRNKNDKKQDRIRKMIQDFHKYRPAYYLQLVASSLSL